MHLFEDQVLEIYKNVIENDDIDGYIDGVPIMLIKFYSLIFVLRNC